MPHGAEQQQLVTPKKAPAYTCASCKRKITGVKLIVNELWHCQECVYYLDRGERPPGVGRTSG